MVQSQVVKVGDQLVGSSRVDIFFGCVSTFSQFFSFTLFSAIIIMRSGILYECMNI